MITPQFTYTQRLCRQYPGLIVILLDQSKSMSDEVEVTNMPIMEGIKKTGVYGKYTKADIATAVINNIIHMIINKAEFDERTPLPKNYLYLCVPDTPASHTSRYER